MIIGIITALGGGTLRDIILGAEQMFWIRDPSYFWVALLSSIIGFFLVSVLRHRHVDRAILYLDTFGIALFSILVTERLLLAHYAAYVAIGMGVITAIFGGVIRDILIQRPTLFNNTEFYATPIILGCCIYSVLFYFDVNLRWSSVGSMAFIIIFRLYTLHKGHQFPSSLLLK